jgi:GH25 family lysozyme M1 (1,4-beta-N-acetylmuramidase)
VTYGIDISLWQGKFDWNKAVNQGVKFAILKASDCDDRHKLFVDPRFKENIASCPLAYRGSYHFLDPLKDGTEQCKFYLDAIGDSCNLIGCLDIEENVWNYFPQAVARAWEFVQEYKKVIGLWPMIYTNNSISEQMQWDSKELKYKFYWRNFIHCPLWVTNYDNVEYPETGPWLQEHIQQITEKGDGVACGSTGSKSIDIDKAILPIDLLLLNPLVRPEPPVIVKPPYESPIEKPIVKSKDIIVKHDQSHRETQ